MSEPMDWFRYTRHRIEATLPAAACHWERLCSNPINAREGHPVGTKPNPDSLCRLEQSMARRVFRFYVLGPNKKRDDRIAQFGQAATSCVGSCDSVDVTTIDLQVGIGLRGAERIRSFEATLESVPAHIRDTFSALSAEEGVIGVEVAEQADASRSSNASSSGEDGDIQRLRREGKELRNRLHAVLESMTDAFYVLDHDWRFTYVNAEAERLLRRERKDLLAKNLWEEYPETVASALFSHYHRAISDRTLQRFEFYYAPFDRWFDVSAYPSPDGLAVSFHDISSRRSAAVQLRLLDTCIERLNDIVLITEAAPLDEPGPRIVFANAAFEKHLGYTREEALGRSPRFLQGPGTSEQARARIRAALEKREPVREELLNYARGGQEVWLELDIVPVTDESGSLSHMVAIQRDITDRKAAESELHKLSLAVEQSSESIMITNAEAEIEYVNASFVRVSGYSRAEVLGRNPRILGSGRTPRETYCSMWAALSEGRAWTGEFHNQRKDGSQYLEAVVISPIRHGDGRITHYVAVKEDVTEKRRIAAELDQYRDNLEQVVFERTRELAEVRKQAEAANEAKSLFLANMSHEIRTPMNGVLGLLDVLAQTRLTEQQADIVRTIQESGSTLLGIIDDILDFSKIEAGRIDVAHAPVAIADIVESLCEALLPLSVRRDVDLSVFVAPEIPERVLSDGLRLRQILYNLIGNAIKFSAGRRNGRGRVLIRAHILGRSPLRLAFIVADNGVGIAPDALERLFMPFSQAEAATTRRFGGAGLGLSIAKRLVSLMGGRISVASAPGDGSIFTVELPFEVPDEQPVKNLPNVAGVHCLLHDEPGIEAGDIAAYLEHAGAHVHRADATSPFVVDPSAHPLVGISVQGPSRALSSIENAKDIPYVLIAKGRRRRPRRLSSKMIVIDGSALKREVLLRAVAQAAGRLSDETGERGESRPIESRPGPLATQTSPAPEHVLLVVEDDEINRKVIMKQLQILGRRGHIAQNGAEALAMWRRRRYDAVLTDLHMPDMDGYQLVNAIRNEEALNNAPAVPIIAVTANALRGEAEAAKQVGITEYLTKPVQLEVLREALDRILPR